MNNFNKFLKNKKSELRKKVGKFKKIFNTISLVYDLKQKHVWHNNYKKKCQLRMKKEINFKQKKLISNSTKILLWYKKQRKKKSLPLQNRWYYNENLQKKKTMLNYYRNNLWNFNSNKTLYKFFLYPRLFKKKYNKIKSFKR